MIQCHVCGKMFKSVGRHVRHVHNLSPKRYKEIYGLNVYTPLVCESTSDKHKEVYIGLSPEKKASRIKILTASSRRMHKEGKFKKRSSKGSIQYNNSFGTCELQAKFLFFKEYNALGRIPKTEEMSPRLKNLVYDRFGGLKKACLTWGIAESEYNEHIARGKEKAKSVRAKNDYFPKYLKNEVVNSYKNFYKKNNRLPTWEEARRLGMPLRDVVIRNFGTTRKAEILKVIQEELNA